MKIAFDAKRIVRNTTGLGNYSRTLVTNLLGVLPADAQLELYAPDAGRDDLRRLIPDDPRLHYVYPQQHSHALQRSLWRVGPIVRDLRQHGVQLYHGLSGELPRGLRRAGIPAVVTIHDLIFLRHPEYYPFIDRHIYAWKFRLACREATRIIAISERTRQDIIQLGHVPPSRIDLIYQSCSPRFQGRVDAATLTEVRRQYRLPVRFILSVGTIEERKNIGLAVRALPYIAGDIHLVAVGRSTPYAERVLADARSRGLAGRVHFFHGVPDAHLQALYQMADVFVYPSRYEGFGIPIIEAIHSHLPVVAATGSCLEEAGGPYSLYVSPDNPRSLAAAITRSLRGAEGREQRLHLSRAYVSRFEGTDVASQVLAVYEKALQAAP